MTAETRALFRQTILEQLANASEMGLPVNTITSGLRMRGFVKADNDETESDLAGFLTSQGYVQCKGSAMSAALSRWMLTGAGRQYLEAQGLA